MPKQADKQTVTINLSYVHVVWALVALNIITILLWKPWQSDLTNARTITVAGEAVVEAEPDEFSFSPYWQLEADSQEAVIEAATAKSDEIVDGLRAIGVEDKDIKLSSNTYDNWWYNEADDNYTASVYITVSVDDRDFAQSVQDYLVTTDPEGQITPLPTFSDELEKQLEDEARELAIADARQKAEQSASELGARVGKVISIDESGYGGDIISLAESPRIEALDQADTSTSFEILPGQNEFRLTVSVVFEIK